MADLSPAAQAVLDAYGHCLGSYEARVNTTRPGVTRLADALCAVADQVVPDEGVWIENGELALQRFCQRKRTRKQLLAIATELEAPQ